MIHERSSCELPCLQRRKQTDIKNVHTDIDTSTAELSQLLNGVDIGACTAQIQYEISTSPSSATPKRTDCCDDSSLQRQNSFSLSSDFKWRKHTLRRNLVFSLGTGALTVLNVEVHSSCDRIPSGRYMFFGVMRVRGKGQNLKRS